LLSIYTKSTTSAHNGDGFAWACSRFLQTFVDGDTSAENGCDGCEVRVLVQTGDVCGAANGVLLERTIGGVAGEEGVWAELMVM